MRPIGKLLAVVTALAASTTVVAGVAVGSATTRSVSVSATAFSVRFPGKPKRSVDTIQTAAGGVKLVSYLYVGKTKREDLLLGVVENTFGSDPALLDAFLQGVVGKTGQLKSVVSTTYQGFPARDARVTRSGNKITIFERAILTRSRIFILQEVRKAADAKSPTAIYRRFRASLKIKAAGL